MWAEPLTATSVDNLRGRVDVEVRDASRLLVSTAFYLYERDNSILGELLVRNSTGDSAQVVRALTLSIRECIDSALAKGLVTYLVSKVAPRMRLFTKLLAKDVVADYGRLSDLAVLIGSRTDSTGRLLRASATDIDTISAEAPRSLIAVIKPKRNQ